MHEDSPIIQRDQRFGGNMERANVGAPYAVASRDYYGGPSKGSPMLDLRYENYQAPHRVDYTSPPYGGPGEPSRGFWEQMRVPEDQGMPRQHPNPRMRHINPRGMAGGIWEGIGSLQEEAAIPNWYKWYDKLIRRFGEEKGSELWHQYASDDTGIGSTNEYQMAELTQDQMNMMGNPLNTPDFGVSKEDLFDRVKGMEDKGFFGWGAQEPTTQEEYDDYYNKLLQGEVGNWVT